MRMEEQLYSLFDATTETHWWFVGRRKIILSFVKRLVAGRPRPRIIDIGCGAGATLKRLEEMGMAIGVDISPRSIAFCRERGCRNLCLVGEERLPFGSARVDLIVSLDVLEHLDEDFEHLREYLRILQRDGRLILTVPALPWLWSGHDRANRHRRRYTRAGLRALLENEGWRIERLSYFCGFLFPLIMTLRLISKAVRKMIKSYNADWNFKIPGWGLNRILSRIFGAEARWILRRDLPIGSSLLAVCRRSGDQEIRKSGDQEIRKSGDQEIRGSGDQGTRSSGNQGIRSSGNQEIRRPGYRKIMNPPNDKDNAGFKKLWVWQKAHQLMLEVHKLAKRMPRSEKYRLGDQIERSSSSVPDNISEGHSSYYYQEKIKAFYIARKEAGETQNHLAWKKIYIQTRSRRTYRKI